MRHPNHIGIAAATIDGAALFYRTLASELAKLANQNLYPEISTHILPLPAYEDILLHKNWSALAEQLLLSIKELAKMEVDLIVLPANTLHFAIDSLEQQSPLPILNILPIVVERCQRLHYQRVAVLGTQLTMSEGLYRKKLSQAGIQEISLNPEEQSWLHQFILREIVPQHITSQSLAYFAQLMQRLKQQGCEAIILACNALPLLIQQQVFDIPVIDSIQLLTQAAIAETAAGKDPQITSYSHLYRYW